jgi:gamma-glutamylcyclotransferase (GGCT)/AIG2-like uncharacterized protein YtfP
MRNDADPPCDLLFVYGTLMSRFHNLNAIALRQAATLVGAATYRGKMFRVSGPRGVLVYPVVIPSDDPADVVHGELYRLIDHRVLDRLDAYEGCAADSPQPHEYRREIAEVTPKNGTASKAMLYVFQGSVAALPRIVDGVFR